MKTAIAICLLFLAVSTNCSYWYKTNEYLEEYQFTCYKQDTGTNSVTLRLKQFGGSFSDESVQNFANAKSAGLTLSAVFQPCRDLQPDTYIQILKNTFSSKMIKEYWLDLPVGGGYCAWDSYPPLTNCNFLQNLVTSIQKKLGAAVGIVTDRQSWYKIFRAYDGCPDVSGYAELWWIPSSSSPNPNFNDYVKIGGWYKPFAKTFNSKTICTFGFDQNYSQ